MPVVSIQNVSIAGIAAAVPPLETRSWDDLSPAEGQCVNARKRNVPPYRRKAQSDQCQSDFCVEAAKKLMDQLGWKFSEIDTVVMSTLTPDYPIPPTAIILQDRLGVPKTAVAFDLPSGDPGFLHGLQVTAGLISPGCLKKALLFSGGASKTFDESDWDEPNRMLCGDSGSVCALEFREGSPAMFFDSGGNGSAFDAFHMPVGGTRKPARANLFADAQSIRQSTDFVLDAKEVAGVAMRELPASLRRSLEAAGKTAAEIDGLYLNSLGLPVETAVRKELQVPRDKFFTFFNEFGDCASGTIPLAMIAGSASRLRAGTWTSLLGSLGSGLAWGSAVLTTSSLVCPDLIEF